MIRCEYFQSFTSGFAERRSQCRKAATHWIQMIPRDAQRINVTRNYCDKHRNVTEKLMEEFKDTYFIVLYERIKE